jgi:hypothetical protein
MAGVALCDIHLRFCGRRHLPSFCVAGVALGDIQLPFAVWHWRHWAGSGGALGPDWSRGDAAALCVAGVALGDIHLRFAWQLFNPLGRFIYFTFHLQNEPLQTATPLANHLKTK